MTETPFFFHARDVRLFGFLHSPAESPAASDVAFVMSHPFGEEKLWSHRVFVSVARALARRGHAVLRFDYTGAGDSDGAVPDTSIETSLSDLRSAILQLRERCGAAKRIGVIGLRLGASIAALLAERAPADEDLAQLCDGPLVLWEPVVDGEGYFQEILRSNLSTQLAVFGKVIENREALQERIRGGGTVNVDGYEIGKPLFESGAARQLVPAASKTHRGATLVVQIAASAQVKDRAELASLADSYARGTLARVVEQPFWREIKPFYGCAAELQKATLDWLEQQDESR